MPDAALASKLVTLLVVAVVAFVLDRLAVRAVRRALSASSIPSASIFLNVVRVLIWLIALISVMEPVFGVSPSAFVTALGVTGIAISFGLKDTISNLVAGFGLMAGKVIQPGDRVRIEDFEGVVKDITWRHTIVVDEAGNQEIVPNSALNTNAVIRLMDTPDEKENA